MKIIVEWSEEDIKVGKFYYRNADNIDVNKNIGYFLSVLHKIGYCNEFRESIENDDSKTDARYVAISMTDGLTYRKFTKSEFAESLTKNNYIPCTGEALQKILAYVADVYGKTN